jgi:cyclopropane fatty-acyl-phospholipid synthase-like methyltransferase
MFSIAEALNVTYVKLTPVAFGKHVLEYGYGHGKSLLMIAKKYNKPKFSMDLENLSFEPRDAAKR